MYEKILFIVILIMFLVALGISSFVIVYAISNKTSNSTSKMISEEKEWKVGQMNKVLSECKNKSIEELPVYSFSLLSNYVGNRYIKMDKSSVGSTLNWLNNVAKNSVDNIQKIDNEHIAVIYKVVEKNYDETYMFIIFEREIDKDLDRETWRKTGEAYFLNEINNSNDYKAITEGDSIEELYKIDKSIHYDVLRNEIPFSAIDKLNSDNINNSELWNESPRMIFKLLEDGILTVEFDVESKIILNKTFYSFESKELPIGVCISSSNILNCFKSSN